MGKQNDLEALHRMLVEAHDVLRTTILTEGRAERVYDLLTAAVSLSQALLEESPAATLGAKGGKETAIRGSEYFRQIAAKRGLVLDLCQGQLVLLGVGQLNVI